MTFLEMLVHKYTSYYKYDNDYHILTSCVRDAVVEAIQEAAQRAMDNRDDGPASNILKLLTEDLPLTRLAKIP